MRKIRKIWCVTLKIWAKNTDFGLFWPKMANFGPFLAKKGPILNFRPKSEISVYEAPGSWEKTGKSDARISQKIRTYGQAWIHRSPRFLETKNLMRQFENMSKKHWVRVKKILQKMKLLVHTLLTGHKPSSLDNFWPRYKLFWHFLTKRGVFGGVFDPLWGGRGGGEKNLQKNETTCPYASNKP